MLVLKMWHLDMRSVEMITYLSLELKRNNIGSSDEII